MSKLYSKGQVYHNGQLLAELQDFDINEAANHNDVMTLADGLAGKAKGAGTSDISMSCFVPKAGYEVRFDELLDGSDNTLSIFSGGVMRSWSGWYMTVNTAGSVNQALMYKMTFRSGPAIA